MRHSTAATGRRYGNCCIRSFGGTARLPASRGVENVADFLQFLQAEHAAYPDAREELLDIFSRGHKVAVRHLFTGTGLGPLGLHPATGRRVRSVYIALYHVENGRITGAWAEWDNLVDLRQPGLEPGRS